MHRTVSHGVSPTQSPLRGALSRPESLASTCDACLWRASGRGCLAQAARRFRPTLDARRHLGSALVLCASPHAVTVALVGRRVAGLDEGYPVKPARRRPGPRHRSRRSRSSRMALLLRFSQCVEERSRFGWIQLKRRHDDGNRNLRTPVELQQIVIECMELIDVVELIGITHISVIAGRLHCINGLCPYLSQVDPYGCSL